MEAERREGGADEVPGRGEILSKSIVCVPIEGFGGWVWEIMLIGCSWSKQIIEHEKNAKNGSS